MALRERNKKGSPSISEAGLISRFVRSSVETTRLVAFSLPFEAFGLVQEGEGVGGFSWSNRDGPMGWKVFCFGEKRGGKRRGSEGGFFGWESGEGLIFLIDLQFSPVSPPLLLRSLCLRFAFPLLTASPSLSPFFPPSPSSSSPFSRSTRSSTVAPVLR